MTLVINLIFIYSSILCITSSESKSAPCSDFHTGTFKYVEKNPLLDPWTIIRTENRQIESNSNTGKTTTWKVTWKSDCEYELNYIENTNDFNHTKKSKMLVSITPINDSSYEYATTASFLENGTVHRGKIMKISDSIK